MESKRQVLETVDAVGQPLKLIISTPNHKVSQEANMAYNLKVSSLIRRGVQGKERLLLRSEVEAYLLSAGVWTIEDTQKLQQLSIEIRAAELAIQRGGIALTEARRMALEMGEKRTEIMALVGKRQQLDSATVESVAENYKFAILATKCIRYADDNKLFFSGYDDFMNRGGEDGVVAACELLAEMVYGVARDIQDNLFESRWLKKAGFVDDTGRLVNKDDHLVDEDGRLVDDQGRFIDENGDFVDLHGVRVTETGDFCCTNPKPFTDDDGNEVDVCLHEPVKPKKTKATKKVSKKKAPKKKKKAPKKNVEETTA